MKKMVPKHLQNNSDMWKKENFWKNYGTPE